MNSEETDEDMADEMSREVDSRDEVMRRLSKREIHAKIQKKIIAI